MSHAIHAQVMHAYIILSIALRVVHSSAFIIIVANSLKQPVPVVQQDTLVYADIGSPSFKKRGKQIVTLSSDSVDDRVVREYMHY